MTLRTNLVLVCLASCLLSPAARAAEALDSDTRAAARQLGYSGIEAFQAGNYREASEKLDKAYRVASVPSLGLWSARALVKLGKLVEAAERYAEVIDLKVSSGDQAVQKRAQAEAKTELAALQPRIPSLIVRLEGAAASETSVSIDGQPMATALLDQAQPMNPGAHRIEGSRGGERAAVEVTLAEGEQESALLKFDAPVAAVPAEPARAEPSPRGLGTQRTLALVAGGVGLVGVGVGTVFGLKSKSSHDEAAVYCSGSVCSDQRGVDAGQDAYSAGTVSTVAMVVGAVGLAGGAVLWLTAPRSRLEPATALGLGPGSLHVRGSF